jgi:hypothetical protein
MKLKALTIAVAVLAVGHTASAQTIIDITGATAYRTATLDTIKARYNASGAAWKLVHDNSTGFNGSTRAIFEGTFQGAPGTTIIRTSFNGSVEGIRALVSTTNNPTYIVTNSLTGVTNAVGGNNGGLGVTNGSAITESAQSEIAFSDVDKAATPFKNDTLQPGANSAIGVVTFTMIGNEGFPTNKVNSLNTQNFRALLALGRLRLEVLSGNPADNAFVYVTGRNDGSGTRTTYMAETGAGITAPVVQYVVGSNSSTAISAIYRVPVGGTNAAIAGLGLVQTNANASTVWGQDLSGNGGYSSGSTLRSDMGRTTTAMTAYATNGTALSGSGTNHLVSFLATADASVSRAAGAAVLGYNGVILSDFATNGILSAADISKVAEGAYTAWSYQHMYRRADLGDLSHAGLVWTSIKDNLVHGTTGISLDDMVAGRDTDGGVVTP